MSGYKISNTDGIVLNSDGKGLAIPSINSIGNASTNVPEGSIIYAIDNKQIYRFNGTTWLVSAGTSGTAGNTGNAGSSGTSGSTGTSGSSGNSGTDGSSGSSGSTGTSGSSGSTGSSGSSGSTGSSGTSGTAGSSGSSGTTGTSGNTGSSGSSGSAGSSGTSGSTGSSGTSGQSVPGGLSILYGGTDLSSTSFVTGRITYSLSSLGSNGGDLRISGVDGNGNTIQNGSTATVLDQLISKGATGSAGHVLTIYERGNAAKINYYTYSTLAKATTPTNTDAIFSSLSYIGGSGESTFTQPVVSLMIVGAAGTSGAAGAQGAGGTAGTSGVSLANARAANSYTATAGQTTFSINYTVGQVEVFNNGLKLSDGDFTATNGTSVILDSPLSAGDIVDIVAYTTGGGIAYSGLSASTPLTYNAQTGAFGITQAGNGTSGFLSATDWASFSAKNATGAQGPAGTAGSSGSSGSAGTSGAIGAQGAAGSSGSSGSTGSSGSSGSTGTSGSAGTSGSSGSSGSTGTSGSSGSTGSSGTSGAGTISGTTNFVPKFTSSTVIGDSSVYVNGLDVYFGYGNNTRIGIDYDYTGTYFYGFATNSNARQTRIICSAPDSNAGISFETGASYSSVTTKMLLTNTGNLGLGTTTPNKNSIGRALTVNASTGNSMYELTTADSSTTAYWEFTGTNSSIINVANGYLRLGTNNTERFRITAGGDVIAGPDGASPSSRLTSHLGTSAITGTNDGIRLQVQSYNDAARNTIVWGQNAGSLTLARFGVEWNLGDGQMCFVWRDMYSSGVGTSELMRLTAGGNVGIGIATPHAPLQFATTVANRKIVLHENYNDDYRFYGFGVNSNTLVYTTGTTNDDHVFFAGSSSTTRNELARIKGNGIFQVPNQPYFKYGIGTKTITSAVRFGTDWGFTVYTGRDCVDSANFNKSNGRFTAPVAGVYLFGVTVMRNGTTGSGPIDFQIVKNEASVVGQSSSSTYGRGYAGSYTTDYEQCTISATIKLAANDYVALDFTGNMSTYEDDSWFYGYLLG